MDENGRRNWGFRYSLDSKPRWMRLGAVDVTGKSGGLTLAQAKHSAAEKRVLVPKGVDPIDQRWAEPATRKTTVEATTARVPSQTPTFEEACEDCSPPRCVCVSAECIERGWPKWSHRCSPGAGLSLFGPVLERLSRSIPDRVRQFPGVLCDLSQQRPDPRGIHRHLRIVQDTI